MKTRPIIFLLTLLAKQLSALDFREQLCAFNPNWENYSLRVRAGKAHEFHSEKEYIQTHLTEVCLKSLLMSLH